ncbi:MAG: molybdopterin-synthase adenylyltransferase MoeB [Pseudomonadota bacterium]
MRLPRGLVRGLLGAWWLVLVLVHSPLVAAGNPVARLLGGTFQAWVLLGIMAGAVAGYAALLSRLKARQVAPVAVTGMFSEAERDRYARHIMLREIGGPGQKRLKAAKVLVIGAGGLGSPALLYLAASGVGVIGVIDDDVVEASNLQRQIIHADQRIGLGKVASAEIAMKALNPFIEVRPYSRRLTEGIAADLVADYDLVLDGSDNFDTRYLANRVCAAAGKPLIAGAITQWEGQVSVWHPAKGGPCYECVFPVRPAPGLVPTCAEAGVASPLPGIIGAMMAMEAVKLIVEAGEGLRGRLMIYDALYADSRVIAVKPRAGCAACGA